MAVSHTHTLKVKDLGIDTYHENCLFIRADSHVCKSEGFTALKRIVIHKEQRKIVASLNVITSDLLMEGEAGLSLLAMKQLQVSAGDEITISPLQPISSLGKVRSKIYQQELDDASFSEIINDIVAGYYSNVEIAAFVSACGGNNLSVKEIISLTRAMVLAGNKLKWEKENIYDKHCVGGLPGNRTTPIVVSIAAVAGLMIPKTSSRAITSPAGTADVMETITNVNLSIKELQNVVNKEGGCFSWGGAVNLSPADDLLITVEKALDIDSEGQMVASVLSKKAAAGSTHVIIDIPVGPSAKVRSLEEALRLQYYFKAAGEAIGITAEIIITDGTHPVGRGIGPALEAMDVLSVLRNDPDAPSDLRERALTLSALLLEMSGTFAPGEGLPAARKFLESGEAYLKFEAICRAQGCFKQPVFAKYHFDVLSETEGSVLSVDNRKLARIAKLAGAPQSPAAGIIYHAPVGKKVQPGDLLFTIYSESIGELEYAKEYLKSLNQLIDIK